MKIPKYVYYVDHIARFNAWDQYSTVDDLECTFIDLFECLSNMILNDDTIYLLRIYEYVKGSHGKKYKRIANVRQGKILEKNYTKDEITRYTEHGKIWYE